MFKRIIGAAVSMSIAVMGAVPVRAADKVSIYVDVNASSDGSGTLGSPFNSIHSAKEAVRNIIGTGKYPENGIEVILRGGRYEIDETLSFTGADSGKANAFVKWKSADNEEAIITMGQGISFEKFKPVEGNSKIKENLSGKIYSVNLNNEGLKMYDSLYMGGHGQIYFYNFGMAEEGTISGGIPVPWVFMGDTAGTLARYPNAGEFMSTGKKISGGNLDDGRWYTSDNVGHKIEGEIKGFKMSVDDDRIIEWKNAEGARMWGVWSVDWSDFDVGVKSIDVGNKIIESTHPSPYELKEGKRWYIYNLLEELDSPGEWYLDKTDGELYIYPPENFTKDSVVTPVFDKKDIVSFDSTAQNIEFSGINFQGTRLNGIRLNNPKNISITESTFEKICSKAITGYGTNIKITNNAFKTIGDGVISLANLGYTANLPQSGNLLEDNSIHDFGLLKSGYGIEIGGSGAVVRGNTIYNSIGNGIGISGNDHLIEKNELYNLLRDKDDAGVIYCVNSMVMRGTVIKDNIIHDIRSSVNGSEGVHGIYLDNYQSGYTVKNNLIYNVSGFGVFINMGSDNTVCDNVFVNTKKGVHVSSGYLTQKPTDRSAYGITESVVNNKAYKKYPHMDSLLEENWWISKYNIVKDNYSYNTDKTFELLPKNISREEALLENEYEEGYCYKSRERYLLNSNFPKFPENTEVTAKLNNTAINIGHDDHMKTGAYNIDFKIKDRAFNLFFEVIKSTDAVFYEDFESYEIGETPSFVTSTGDTISGTVCDDGTGNKVLKVAYKNEASNEQKYNYLTLNFGKNYDYGKYSYDYRVKIVNTANGCLSPFMTMYNSDNQPIMTRQSIKGGFVFGQGYTVARNSISTDKNGYYLIKSKLDIDNKKQTVPQYKNISTKEISFDDNCKINFSQARIRGILGDPLGIKAQSGSEYASNDTEIYFIDDISIAPLEFSDTGIYADSVKLESLSNALGKTVTARIDVGELSDNNEDITVIFALYDGDKLLEVKTVEREKFKAHHAEAAFALPTANGEYKIICTAFDSLSGMKPLLKEKVVFE